MLCTTPHCGHRARSEHIAQALASGHTVADGKIRRAFKTTQKVLVPQHSKRAWTTPSDSRSERKILEVARPASRELPLSSQPKSPSENSDELAA